MEHELKPGTYCRPASNAEWIGVVKIAESLQLLFSTPASMPYERYCRIWVWGSGESPISPLSNTEPETGPRVPVPYFISAMYRLAEKRKASPEPQAADIGVDRNTRVRADGVQEWWDGKMWKEFPTHSFNEGAADLLRRVSNLETALNEHMVAYRCHVHHTIPGHEWCGAPIDKNTAAGAGDQVTNDEQHRYKSWDQICHDAIGFDTAPYVVTVHPKLDPKMENMHSRAEPTGLLRSVAMFGPYVPPGQAKDECERLNEAYRLGAVYGIARNASPKNIPFEVALAYLKAGRKVRRTSWLETLRVEPRNGGIGGLEMIYQASLNRGSFEPKQPDMVATDWEVVPEP